MIWIEKNLAFEFEVWYNLTGLTEVRTNTYADDEAGAGRGASGKEADGRY